MRLRRRTLGVLPAVVAATFLLVPGVSAAARHPKFVKHKVAKHHLPRVPKRRLSQRVPKRKQAHRATARRAPRKYRRIHHVVYRRRHHFYRRRRWARYGPSSSRIEQIQMALTRSGYYHGDPTGRWDSTTVTAMKDFQRAHGITPTGRIDVASLQKLGLGSDIAGVAPPRPILPSDTANSNKESESESKPVGEGR